MVKDIRRLIHVGALALLVDPLEEERTLEVEVSTLDEDLPEPLDVLVLNAQLVACLQYYILKELKALIQVLLVRVCANKHMSALLLYALALLPLLYHQRGAQGPPNNRGGNTLTRFPGQKQLQENRYGKGHSVSGRTGADSGQALFTP